MASIQFVAAIAVGLISAIATQPETGGGIGDWGLREFLVLWVLLMVPASIPAACYEVVSTARRGQTFGKRGMEVRVELWNGYPVQITHAVCVPYVNSFVRWAVPHLLGAVAAIVAGVASFQTVQGGRDLLAIAAGAGLGAWMLVYASSLWDKDRRGWHDKAAGTVVIKEMDPVPARERDPVESRVAREARRWQ